MSASVANVPQWKTQLMEKKRRQEDGQRKISQEELRLAQMPEWKRNIIMKKRTQKNSNVFLAAEPGSMSIDVTRRDSCSSPDIGLSPRSNTSNASDDVDKKSDSSGTSNHGPLTNGVSEADPDEHLLPVQENPWFRTDPGAKRYRSPKPTSRGDSSTSSLRNVSNTSVTGYDKQVSHENDEVFFKNGDDDDIVEYGQGFVHKLLKRFTTLTNNEEQQYHPHAKRSHSADNLLDDSPRNHTLPRTRSTYDSMSTCPRKNSASMALYTTKTRSVDDLLDGSSSNGMSNSNLSCNGSNSHDISDSPQPGYSSDSEHVTVDELPRPNTVSSTRSIFESASSKSNTLFSSLRKSKSQDIGLGSSTHYKRSASPVMVSTQPSHAASLPNGDVSNHDRNDNLGYSTNNAIPHSKSADDVAYSNLEESVSKKQATEQSIKNIQAAGRSWYFSGSESREVKVNRFSSDNNSNFTESQSTSVASSLDSTSSVISAPGLTNNIPAVSGSTTNIEHNNEINNRINASSSVDQPFQSCGSEHSKLKGDYSCSTKYASTTSKPEPLAVRHNNITNDHKVTNNYIASSNTENSSMSSVQNAMANHKAVRPSSLPQNNRDGVYGSKDDLLDASRSIDSSTVSNMAKKRVPTSTTNAGNKGPGRLLVRPATNVVPSSSVPFLDLNSYEDVHVFKPPRKNPPQGKHATIVNVTGGDIPVTNIDDITDDIPVTYIDDTSPSKSPKSELDADHQRKVTSGQYEFIGAGVTFGKSLLCKSGRGKKMRLQFNDDATATYEYPSESSLLEDLPPSEDDYTKNSDSVGSQFDDCDDDRSASLSSSNIMNQTNSVTSAGGLGAYKSRYVPDYQFGMEIQAKPKHSLKHSGGAGSQQRNVAEEQVGIKPADDEDTSTWSGAGTSDMLF